jgi:hypothetical protein|tara:strand:- start:529 stop:1554 length:1026 start_codon:yes stop_codon:yes gene_type:complete
MLNILSNHGPTGKLPAGAKVSGCLKEIHPCSATEPTKQRIQLCAANSDGSLEELGCNLIGENIHRSLDEIGNVLTFSLAKEGAGYVSKFDDGKFLTIREGQVVVKSEKPDSPILPKTEDRVHALASFYVTCRNAVTQALSGQEISTEEGEISKVAMAVFLDTKCSATISRRLPPPTKAELPTKADCDVTPPNDAEVPSSEQEGDVSEDGDPPPSVQEKVQRLMSLEACSFVEKAANCFATSRSDEGAPVMDEWKAAFIAATDLHGKKTNDVGFLGMNDAWGRVYHRCLVRLGDPQASAVTKHEDVLREKFSGREDWEILKALCITIDDILLSEEERKLDGD